MKTNNLIQKGLALNPVKSNKGFSLIELLVVIGIIGILAAVAIPAYKSYQNDAKIGVTESILQTAYRTVQINNALDKETTKADLTAKVTSKGAPVTFAFIGSAPAATTSGAISITATNYCFSVTTGTAAAAGRPAGCGAVAGGVLTTTVDGKGASTDLICNATAGTCG